MTKNNKAGKRKDTIWQSVRKITPIIESDKADDGGARGTEEYLDLRTIRVLNAFLDRDSTTQTEHKEIVTVSGDNEMVLINFDLVT